MDDYISRKKAIDEVLSWATRLNHPQDLSREDTVYALQHMDAADVVEVVRCRDCKHRGWTQEPCHGKIIDYCHLIEHCIEEDFFCAAYEARQTVENLKGGEE